MTGEEVKDWLDAEVEQFPQRASGEDLYRYIVQRTKHAAESDRWALVSALTVWLGLRSEPKTMLAVEIISKHNVVELRSAVEQLLADVLDGEAFKAFYEQPIRSALEEMD